MELEKCLYIDIKFENLKENIYKETILFLILLEINFKSKFFLNKIFFFVKYLSWQRLSKCKHISNIKKFRNIILTEMHEAYDLLPLLKLTVQIESIAAYGKILIICSY